MNNSENRKNLNLSCILIVSFDEFSISNAMLEINFTNISTL